MKRNIFVHITGIDPRTLPGKSSGYLVDRFLRASKTLFALSGLLWYLLSKRREEKRRETMLPSLSVSK